MNTDAIESMVRDVLSRMNSLQGEAPTAAPAADGAAAAQADCLSGPDRRQGYHQGGLQDHRRAWEVVPAGRRPDDGYLPSLRAAAGCGEAAGDLCGPESYSGQGAGDLHPHGLLNREALPPGFLSIL